jgi:hypothetical protein
VTPIRSRTPGHRGHLDHPVLCMVACVRWVVSRQVTRPGWHVHRRVPVGAIETAIVLRGTTGGRHRIGPVLRVVRRNEMIVPVENPVRIQTQRKGSWLGSRRRERSLVGWLYLVVGSQGIRCLRKGKIRSAVVVGDGAVVVVVVAGGSGIGVMERRRMRRRRQRGVGAFEHVSRKRLKWLDDRNWIGASHDCRRGC